MTYITKGDSNEVIDQEKVLPDEIEGKYIFKIPFLGGLSNVLKSGLVIILVILIFLVIYLTKVDAKEKSEIRREKKKIEDKKFFNE